jgi:hypothetical protein
MKILGGKTRAIKINASKPIHLRIKKTWAEIEIITPKVAGRPFSIREDLDDLPMLNDDV